MTADRQPPGHPVLAADRDAAALEKAAGGSIHTLQVDLEQASGGDVSSWPFEADRFAGIVVTNYLYRPLFPHILASLAPNGLLIYETFAQGNERFGRPSNPDFLLAPGELLNAVLRDRMQALRVIAFEDGHVLVPKPAMVQRICALQGSTVENPERLLLT